MTKQSSIQCGSMTSRERVGRAFDHADHDRVPRYDAYWSETLQRWSQEGLANYASASNGDEGDNRRALNLLDADLQAVAGSWPAPFPGQHHRLREDDLTEDVADEWGALTRRWKHRSGTPEHLGFGCYDKDQWTTRYLPAYQALQPSIDIPAARNRHTLGRSTNKWCYFTALESIEGMRRLLGDEITLISMAEDPDWIAEVSQVYTDAVLRGLDALCAAGFDADGLWVYGDMAFNHTTVCSPTMYRQLVWPDHKRLADWGHAHGMKVIFHTDGNVNGVMQDYVNAGFDCLQPLEAKAGMDIRKLCPTYGRELVFFGNIDVMKLMTNDPTVVEDEVRSKLEAGMSTRGYIYHSDHSVPPQVSLLTYRLVIELLNQYGSYE